MARDVIMPALGMAQKTGVIVAWRKQPGEAIKAGDVLMEVETDKAVMEVAADADGYLTDVRAEAGQDIPVGDVIARIAETAPAKSPPPPKPNGATPAAVAPPKASTTPEAGAASPNNDSDARSVAPSLTLSKGGDAPSKPGRIFASPRARRLAKEEGLDLGRLIALGESPPYLVRHLDTLRKAPPESTTPAAAQGALAAPAWRLTASAPRNRFAEFCAWRQTETGEETNELVVMAGMASASFRESAGDGAIHVKADSRSFVDADRAGLGAAEASEPSTSPTVVLRNLHGAITELQLGAEAAPVLTVIKREADLFVTLECAPRHLQPEAAIALISGFTGRLADPLRHLL